MADSYEQWMNNMCCEDRWCVKCGAWYADSDPNERVCDTCPMCPEGQCWGRNPDYCDHDWQSSETPSQAILRAASKEPT